MLSAALVGTTAVGRVPPARAAAPAPASAAVLAPTAAPTAAPAPAAAGSKVAPATAISKTAPASAVASADAAAAQGAVKALINAIRYGRDALADKRLDLATMGACLLGREWQQLSAAERTHVADGFAALLRGEAYPRGRAMFQYLDAILFAPPQRQGDQLHLGCTLVVHRELKKVEIPLVWVLTQTSGAWKVVDIVAQDESTCAGIHDEEVAPLLREGGKTKLLAVLDARVAAVTAKAGKPAHGATPPVDQAEKSATTATEKAGKGTPTAPDTVH